MPPTFLRAACGLLALPTLASAHDNGMDMSMDGGMTLTEGQMLPYLHFTTGDMLWFMGWVPQSSGAMVGACIGLFLLAIVERWIATCRAVMQAHWAKRYVSLPSSYALRLMSPQSCHHALRQDERPRPACRLLI